MIIYMKSAAAKPRCPKGQWRNRVTGRCEPHNNLADANKVSMTDMDAANILLSFMNANVVAPPQKGLKRTKSQRPSNNRSPGKKTQKNNITTIPGKKPTGVQAHGKEWENELIAAIVPPERLQDALNQPYTARHDIDRELHILPGGRHISIKATKRNAVDFGDALRTIENVEKTSPLEAIIIKYKQSGNKKEPTEITRIDLNNPNVYLGPNFNNIRADIIEIDRLIKAGRPKHEYDRLVKHVQTYMKADNAELLITPKKGNPVKKRAGRLQISLRNLTNIKRQHPEIIIDSDELVKVENLSKLESAARVFAKKIVNGKQVQANSIALAAVASANS
jgi:hypothetical protein